MSVAVLVALSLALSTWAAEPPKPAATPDKERFVVESARDLPVADEVDIVVVNGNFAGIAAAVEAAQAGCALDRARVGPHGLQAGVEGRGRAVQRLQAQAAGDVGHGRGVLGLDHSQRLGTVGADVAVKANEATAGQLDCGHHRGGQDYLFWIYFL
jgi:hypothetical protein